MNLPNSISPKPRGYLAALLWGLVSVCGLNAAPVVSNVAFIQRAGTKMVDVSYDLAVDGPLPTVKIEVSSDGGTTWTVPVNTVSGAVGAGITGGPGKLITWDAGTDWNEQNSSLVKVRVTAWDLLLAGSTFVPIAGGSVQRGNVIGDTDPTIIAIAPVQTITVSSFYLQTNETTKAQWDLVRTWGSTNDYTDLAVGAGKANNHPVQTVSWYDVVKWCNAASEMEGLTPVYYTDVEQTTVYRIGSTDIDNTMVKWSANGYRLPTEAEWEKAARGGLTGKRFPWGDTVSRTQANYYVNSSNGSSNNLMYDVGSPIGYDPRYATGDTPYTSPVGSFQANDFGLHDMAGNVTEWCWDWYGAYSTGSDPKGPSSGSNRIVRGGSWRFDASPLRCAMRGDFSPFSNISSRGFRPARVGVEGVNGTASANGSVTTLPSPTVTTPSAGSITASGASLGGNVTSDEGALITERGVVYSATATNADPLISGTGVTKVATTGTTGVFTVAVTGLLPETSYSYKAYAINSQGVSYTSVAIFTTLSTNADLSALTLSSGILSPIFASGTISYNASVSNATASITVTTTRAQANASIDAQVNDGAYAAVTSGIPSDPLPLNVGSNTVDVRVTAQDGATEKTYTVTVIRMAPPTVSTPTATLITATGAVLGGNVTANGGASITERGVVYSATMTNADPLIGSTSVTKVTATGNTGLFNTLVTGLAQGTGYSYKAYAINSQGTTYTSVATFTSLSTNADLSGLTLSSGSLTPTFASGTGAYIANVSNATTSITAAPTSAQANARIEARVNDGTYVVVSSGSPSASLSLNLGINTVNLRVTAEAGNTRTYTVSITRLAAPSVTSPNATSITATAAALGGNATSDGGTVITERGVVFSATATNANPLISGTGVTKVVATGTTGIFTVPATGLTQGTGYSYKAYASNSQGTTYTSNATFVTTTTFVTNYIGKTTRPAGLSAGGFGPVFEFKQGRLAVWQASGYGRIGLFQVSHVDNGASASHVATIEAPDRTYDNPNFGHMLAYGPQNTLFAGSPHTWLTGPHDGLVYQYNVSFLSSPSFVSKFAESPHTAGYFGSNIAVDGDILITAQGSNGGSWQTRSGAFIYRINPDRSLTLIKTQLRTADFMIPAGAAVSGDVCSIMFGYTVGNGTSADTWVFRIIRNNGIATGVEGPVSLAFSNTTIDASRAQPSGGSSYHSVALKNNRLAVSVFGNDTTVSDNSVRLYTISNIGTLSAQPEGTITSPDVGSSSRFGRRLLFAGADVLMVSDPLATRSGTTSKGKVYVYERTAPAQWAATSVIEPQTANPSEAFGDFMSMDATPVSGDALLAVGARTDAANMAADHDIYLFNLNKTGHSSWRQANFGVFTNTGTAADDADPDGDGLNNLLEYALNLPPNAAGRVPASVQATGGNLEYLYERSTAAFNGGTTYQVEWSDDLTTWSGAGVVETLLSDDGTTQQVKATLPAGSGGRRFVRLRVQ